MPTLKQLFKQSLQEYKDTDTTLLSLDEFVARLQQELPFYFTNWLKPEYTGQATLAPIARVAVEIDASGYIYTSLYNEKKICMVSEGASPDLYEWKLQELYDKAPTLVARFLALCYEAALPLACQSSEFLSLPRSEKIIFSVGEHSGWECEEVFVYTGKRHEINYGNIRLKQLRNASNCVTKPNTVERKFMEHLNTMDVQKYAEEFYPVFKEFFHWLAQQKPEPLEAITIAWSSDFNKEARIGAFNDKAYRWPGSFELYKWFSEEQPEDLDHDDMVNVRYCISHKIAEIACLATERIAETKIFKALPKQENFIMEVMNRTAGYPPLFYPFNTNEDDHF